MPDLRKKHFLLSEHPGWRVLHADRVRVNDCGCLELAEQGAGRPLSDPAGTFGGLALPTGFAADPSGDLYFADPSRCLIKLLRACEKDATPLPCIGPCGSQPRQLDDPRGLALNGRGDLLVVDRGNQRVQVFTVKGLALRSIWRRQNWDPFDIVLGAACTAYVSDTAGNKIHVFDSNGSWQYAWATPNPTHLAIDRDGSIYVVEDGSSVVRVYDSAGKLLKTVQRVDEVRHLFCPIPESVVRAAATLGIALAGPPPLYEIEGTVWLGPLDSDEYRCEWHRVEVHGLVPAGGTITVDTFTSEAEKSAEEILSLPEERWQTRAIDSSVGRDPWDCLVLSPRGRFLWLRLAFAGEGLTTPSLGRIRIDYPRITSLEFLPGVFQEVESSRDFLNRFLSVADRTRDKIESRVDAFPRYLEPMAVPETFLGWLAGWMGMALENQWPLLTRRKLLKAAPLLYRLRGKPAGLAKHLEIYLGRAPRILEHFRLRRWAFSGTARLGDSRLFGKAIAARLQLEENSVIGSFQLIDTGDPALDAFSEYAHRFTVIIAGGRMSEMTRRSVDRIVEMAKPAHTEATVVAGDGRLIIGKQSFIGVDTLIGSYPTGVPLGKNKLGRETVLSPSAEESRPPSWRIGGSARVGAGTVLD